MPILFSSTLKNLKNLGIFEVVNPHGNENLEIDVDPKNNVDNVD